MMKLAGTEHMHEEFEKFGYPFWIARATALIELTAVAGLIAGFWQPACAASASLLLAVTMVGASYVNFVQRGPRFGYGVLVLMLLCLVPAIYYKDSLPLL